MEQSPIQRARRLSRETQALKHNPEVSRLDRLNRDAHFSVFNLLEQFDYLDWNDEALQTKLPEFLVGPRLLHGLGCALLDRLFSKVSDHFLLRGVHCSDPEPSGEFSDVEVVREHPTQEDRFIDRNIRDEVHKFAVISENKVRARESHKQFEDYWKDAERKDPDFAIAVLLLSPHGRKPESAVEFPVVSLSARELTKILEEASPNRRAAESEREVRICKPNGLDANLRQDLERNLTIFTGLRGRIMIDHNFRMLETNGIRLRTVVEGEGQLVILLHGWPQCWYLWRHQIDPIVEAGFQVAVPDQRGFGGSELPLAITDYNIRTLAADIAGIAPALGHDTFTLVGHDWGCVVAWNTALLHEQTCTAVMGLSVPFWRLAPEIINPPGMDDRFWYIRYFQQPGVAEAELERDFEHSLLSIYYTLSGDAPPASFMKQLEHPRSSGLLDTMLTPKQLPSWLTRKDLDYYVEQYRASGFRGGLNWYRNVPTNDSMTPELESKRFTQPAAFVSGVADDVLLYDPDWRTTFPKAFDDLRFIELVKGAGHWVQVEKPEETTALILRFLKGL